MERRGTEDGEKETIRKVLKKLIKKSFERRWIGKFLDNREGYIGDNNKIVLRLFT